MLHASIVCRCTGGRSGRAILDSLIATPSLRIRQGWTIHRNRFRWGALFRAFKPSEHCSFLLTSSSALYV